MKHRLHQLSGRLIPKAVRSRGISTLRRWTRWPPVGRVRFGSLRRLSPFSREWGFDRGKPVDRYYIEKFLEENASDICGRVLEIGTNRYTHLFGGERVTKSDVLHVSEKHPHVTVIADLTQPDQLPPSAFDCVILTGTLHVIYDIRSALSTVHQILKPGGVLLLTAPGISSISRYDFDRWGDYWRFTTRSVKRLLEECFPPSEVRARAYGNVLVATAFLYGLAAEELERSELEHSDPDYHLLIAARARKPGP
jgi:SAM-dependent methyltransferase